MHGGADMILVRILNIDNGNIINCKIKKHQIANRIIFFGFQA